MYVKSRLTGQNHNLCICSLCRRYSRTDCEASVRLLASKLFRHGSCIERSKYLRSKTKSNIIKAHRHSSCLSTNHLVRHHVSCIGNFHVRGLRRGPYVNTEPQQLVPASQHHSIGFMCKERKAKLEPHDGMIFPAPLTPLKPLMSVAACVVNAKSLSVRTEPHVTFHRESALSHSISGHCWKTSSHIRRMYLCVNVCQECVTLSFLPTTGACSSGLRTLRLRGPSQGTLPRAWSFSRYHSSSGSGGINLSSVSLYHCFLMFFALFLGKGRPQELISGISGFVDFRLGLVNIWSFCAFCDLISATIFSVNRGSLTLGDDRFDSRASASS